MLEAPPFQKRPTWKAETIVWPQPKLSGSSSVRCWLVLLWYGSLLIWVSVPAADTSRLDERVNTIARGRTRMATIRHLNREIRDIIVPPERRLPPTLRWTIAELALHNNDNSLTT